MFNEKNILLLIYVFICYFIGSIPWGYLLAKLIGRIDIRKQGSGNIGAANVSRVLGKKYGILVFFLDALKGFCCSVLISYLYIKSMEGKTLDESERLFYCYLFGFFAVFGHIFSCFLRFRGGKGVATALGAVFSLLPGETLIALGLWLLILSFSGYISLASIIASLSLPVLTLFVDKKVIQTEIIIILVALSIIIILRHKDNIKRLARREEYNVWKR